MTDKYGFHNCVHLLVKRVKISWQVRDTETEETLPTIITRVGRLFVTHLFVLYFLKVNYPDPSPDVIREIRKEKKKEKYRNEKKQTLSDVQLRAASFERVRNRWRRRLVYTRARDTSVVLTKSAVSAFQSTPSWIFCTELPFKKFCLNRRIFWLLSSSFRKKCS